MSFLKNLGFKPLQMTESVRINTESKELEETRAYMTTLSKKLKKAMKTAAVMAECSSQLHTAFMQFSSSALINQSESPLGSSLEKCGSFEVYFGELLKTLSTNVDMSVAEQMNSFAKDDIPQVLAIKKKFDAGRRDYDVSITRVTQLQKEKKPNPPKIQQAEQERDRMKQQYIARGDEAYSSLVDINERSQFEILDKLLKYFESFYQFFSGGYNFFREFHEKDMVKYRQWIAEEKEKFEVRRTKRDKSAWAPDFISGESLTKTRQFGVPLDELIERDNPTGRIPVFISNILQFVESKGLATKGVFRISAPKNQLDDLKKTIDQGKEVDFEAIDDVHVCTGILKLFLRELPEPLMTYDSYEKFTKATSLEENPEEQIQKLKELVRELPKENFSLLKDIIRIMCLVEKNKDENKMTATNLAVVLCPSILYPEEPNPTTMVEDIEKCNQIMSVVISNYSYIFDCAVSKSKRVSSKKKTKKRSSEKKDHSTEPKSDSLVPPTSIENQSVESGENRKKERIVCESSDGDLESVKLDNLEARITDPVMRSCYDIIIHLMSLPQSLLYSEPFNWKALNFPDYPAIVSNPMDFGTIKDNVLDGKIKTTDQFVQLTSLVFQNAMLFHSNDSSQYKDAEFLQKEFKSMSDDLNIKPTEVKEPEHQILPDSEPQVPLEPQTQTSPEPEEKQYTLEEISSLVRHIPLTDEYYKSFGVLIGEVCTFTEYALSENLGDNIQPLNEALKNVARSIRDNIGTIKSLSEVLPPELARRLVDVGKDLQRGILQIANAFKEFTTQESSDLYAKFIKATKDFVHICYIAFIRIKETTLTDELTVSSIYVIESAKKVLSALHNVDKDKPTLAFSTNILLNSSFRFGALLRSKVLDSQHQETIEKLTKCIENCETFTKKVYETISPIFSGQNPSNETLNELTNTIDNIIATSALSNTYLPQLFAQNNPLVSNLSLFDPILEQMRANIGSLQSNPSNVIKGIVNILESIEKDIIGLQPLLLDIRSKMSEFLECSHQLGKKVGLLSTYVGNLVEKTKNDPTLKLAFERYTKSTANLAILLKMASLSTLFDLKLGGIQENLRYMTALKDFVFLTFPFATTLNSASSIL